MPSIADHHTHRTHTTITQTDAIEILHSYWSKNIRQPTTRGNVSNFLEKAKSALSHSPSWYTRAHATYPLVDTHISPLCTFPFHPPPARAIYTNTHGKTHPSLSRHALKKKRKKCLVGTVPTHTHTHPQLRIIYYTRHVPRRRPAGAHARSRDADSGKAPGGNWKAAIPEGWVLGTCVCAVRSRMRALAQLGVSEGGKNGGASSRWRLMVAAGRSSAISRGQRATRDGCCLVLVRCTVCARARSFGLAFFYRRV